MVELYHGSQRVIERPVLGAGNPHNDFGPGFYCTKSCDMACEWACTADSDGYANRYQLDEDGQPYSTSHRMNTTFSIGLRSCCRTASSRSMVTLRPTPATTS